MSHKIRLGPIAVFLTVIAVVLSTLAMLTAATSHADKVLAERFAYVTKIRYEIEAEGEQFVRDFDEASRAGAVDAALLGASETEEGYEKTIEKEGYSLTVEVSAPDAKGDFEITKWKLSKNWNADDPLDDLWKGE